MPLPPPVTTTILPLTCIATPEFSETVLRQNQIEHGRVVARRAEKHETMPDHILEPQPLPCVEDYPKAVQQATGENEPERHLRQRGEASVIGDDAAPAHGEVKPDRQTIEAAREDQLHCDAHHRDAPDAC